MGARHEGEVTGPIELSAGLPILELCRIRNYAGNVARVSRHGPHRLLELEATCADGRGLRVWVSCSALEDAECQQLAQRLAEFPERKLVVGFHGRFADILNPRCLTTDVHYPRSIWVQTADQDAEPPKD